VTGVCPPLRAPIALDLHVAIPSMDDDW